MKYTFVAADCGRQPRTDNRERIVLGLIFSDLKACEWSITGEKSKYYNCLAWAVGRDDVWVDDVLMDENGVSIGECVREGVVHWGIDKKYGNGNGKRDLIDIDGFFLKEANAVPAMSVREATIIYYDKYHAAKKMNCDCGSGRWEVFESKCGEGRKMEHVYDQITCVYGPPVRFYKPRP